MTPAQFITHIRHRLDDPANMESKVNTFWSDEDIIRQLDASQDEIVRLAHEFMYRFRLTGLLTLQIVPITADREEFTLNQDYFLPATVTHNGKAGRLMQLREAVHYQPNDLFSVLINGRIATVTGIRGGTVNFWYYRKPQSFALNPLVQRRELPEILYHGIRQHCSALLARKDAGNSRFQKALQQSIRQMFLTKSPALQVYAEDVL